jgi:MFS family permease
MSDPDPPATANRRRDRASAGEAWRLGLLFGAIYFLQGIGEPTDGLIAQPVRSLLKTWGRSAGEITTFSALLALPWAFKPLYGLLSDFVPLFGTRRKGYLILASVATALSLLGLFAFPVRPGAVAALLGWLLIPSVALAFADVVADALMIERGQPRGLTGRLQAVQWGCLYAAGIVTGLVGGTLSEGHRESWAFLLCGVAGVLTLALALTCVREPTRVEPRPGWRTMRAVLAQSARSGTVLGVGGFLFLWNFNPFSNAVLHVHMTRALGFSERFYGVTVALTAVASMAASAGYGLYCRRVPMSALVHASIVLGVASTIAYAAIGDERSAMLVTLVVGVTYMTATLIQLDLAAQTCPPEVAGTVFALLMALENLAASASTWLGGLLYERGSERWGSRCAFQVLVLVGSAFTASCWLLVPLLPRVAAPGSGDARGGS